MAPTVTDDNYYLWLLKLNHETLTRAQMTLGKAQAIAAFLDQLVN